MHDTSPRVPRVRSDRWRCSRSPAAAAIDGRDDRSERRSAAQPRRAAGSLAGRWHAELAGPRPVRHDLRRGGSAAVEGTIAPEGGCPGKFFTSRKWTFEQARSDDARPHRPAAGAACPRRPAASRARRRAASRCTAALTMHRRRRSIHSRIYFPRGSWSAAPHREQPCPNTSSTASPSPATPIAPR